MLHQQGQALPVIIGGCAGGVLRTLACWGAAEALLGLRRGVRRTADA